jgi:hypothetical protein
MSRLGFIHVLKLVDSHSFSSYMVNTYSHATVPLVGAVAMRILKIAGEWR